MAKGQKVTIDNLAEAINDIMDEYKDDVQGNISKITKAIGQKGAQALRNKAHEEVGGKKYYKGWTYITYEHPLYTTIVIYNKGQAGLAHLLEHGHVVRNGTGRCGEWGGITHIKPVEEELITDYERNIVNALN